MLFRLSDGKINKFVMQASPGCIFYSKTIIKICFIICSDLYTILNGRKIIIHFGCQRDVTPASAYSIFILESQHQHQLCIINIFGVNNSSYYYKIHFCLFLYFILKNNVGLNYIIRPTG